MIGDFLALELLSFGKTNLTFTGQTFDFSDNAGFGTIDFRSSDETLYVADNSFPEKIKIYQFSPPTPPAEPILPLENVANIVAMFLLFLLTAGLFLKMFFDKK